MPKKSILIVDDDQYFRAVLSVMLKTAGYKVVEARTARDATEQLAERKPALVIVDYRMPGTDGIAWVQQMRESGIGIPMVLLSGSGMEQKNINKLRGLLGVQLILRKPIDQNTFIDQIQAVIAASNVEPAVSSVLFEEADAGGRNLKADCPSELSPIDYYATEDYGVVLDQQTANDYEQYCNDAKARSASLECNSNFSVGFADFVNEYDPLENFERANREAETELMDEVSSAMEAIRVSYLANIRTEIERVEELLTKWNTDPCLDDVHELSSITHKIRGSAGSYGLDTAGQVAGQIEDLVNQIDSEEGISKSILEDASYHLVKLKTAVLYGSDVSALIGSSKESQVKLIEMPAGLKAPKRICMDKPSKASGTKTATDEVARMIATLKNQSSSKDASSRKQSDPSNSSGGTQRESQKLKQNQSQKLAQSQSQELALSQSQKLAQSQSQELAQSQSQELAQSQSQKLAQIQRQKLAQRQSQELAQIQSQKLAQRQSQELAPIQSQKLAQSQSQRLAQSQSEKLAQSQSKELAQSQSQKLAHSQSEKLAQSQSQELAQNQSQKLAQSQSQELAQSQSQKLGQSQSQKLGQSQSRKRSQGQSAKLEHGEHQKLEQDQNEKLAQGASQALRQSQSQIPEHANSDKAISVHCDACVAKQNASPPVARIKAVGLGRVTQSDLDFGVPMVLTKTKSVNKVVQAVSSDQTDLLFIDAELYGSVDLESVVSAARASKRIGVPYSLIGSNASSIPLAERVYFGDCAATSNDMDSPLETISSGIEMSSTLSPETVLPQVGYEMLDRETFLSWLSNYEPSLSGFSIAVIKIEEPEQQCFVNGRSAHDRLMTLAEALILDAFRFVDVRCKWSGDKIIIAFPGLNANTARDAAECFRAQFERPQIINPKQGSVTPKVSIGVTQSEMIIDIDRLLEFAFKDLAQANSRVVQITSTRLHRISQQR